MTKDDLDGLWQILRDEQTGELDGMTAYLWLESARDLALSIAKECERRMEINRLNARSMERSPT